jgi:hypothetical protein
VLQHHRHDQILLVGQMALQHPCEAGEVGVKGTRRIAPRRIGRLRQRQVRCRGEAVDEGVQVMVVVVEHRKPARDARLQRGKLRKIGLVLDLVMADQIAQKARPQPRQPAAPFLRPEPPVDHRLGVGPQQPQHPPEAEMPVEPEGRETAESGMRRPAIAGKVGEQGTQRLRQSVAAGERQVLGRWRDARHRASLASPRAADKARAGPPVAFNVLRSGRCSRRTPIPRAASPR